MGLGGVLGRNLKLGGAEFGAGTVQGGGIEVRGLLGLVNLGLGGPGGWNLGLGGDPD